MIKFQKLANECVNIINLSNEGITTSMLLNEVRVNNAACYGTYIGQGNSPLAMAIKSRLVHVMEITVLSDEVNGELAFELSELDSLFGKIANRNDIKPGSLVTAMNEPIWEVTKGEITDVVRVSVLTKLFNLLSEEEKNGEL